MAAPRTSLRLWTEPGITALAFPSTDPKRTAAEHPLRAKLVQLRFFVGLSNEEAAKVLGISGVTAKRYWRYARAWLHRKVGKLLE